MLTPERISKRVLRFSWPSNKETIFLGQVIGNGHLVTISFPLQKSLYKFFC